MQNNLHSLIVVIAAGYSLLALALGGLLFYVFRLADNVADLNWNLIRNDVSPRFDAVMKLIYAVKVDLETAIAAANTARESDYARLTAAFKVLTRFAAQNEMSHSVHRGDNKALRSLLDAEIIANGQVFQALADVLEELRKLAEPMAPLGQPLADRLPFLFRSRDQSTTVGSGEDIQALINSRRLRQQKEGSIKTK